jgi:hypothetical protein
MMNSAYQKFLEVRKPFFKKVFGRRRQSEMLTIEELVLRVPGINREGAQSLGNEVSSLVADGLSAQQGDRHMGALDLRVTVPPGATRSRMAKLIAEAILKGLV